MGGVNSSIIFTAYSTEWLTTVFSAQKRIRGIMFWLVGRTHSTGKFNIQKFGRGILSCMVRSLSLGTRSAWWKWWQFRTIVWNESYLIDFFLTIFGHAPRYIEKMKKYKNFNEIWGKVWKTIEIISWKFKKKFDQF